MPPTPFTAGLPPGSLAGQVIVVLGVPQDLADAFSATLGYLGAQVVLTNPAAGAQGEDALPVSGPPVRIIPTEPESEASLAALVDAVHTGFGPVDAIIQAAPAGETIPILKLSLGEWESAVSATLRRAFLVSQAFLPAMLTRRQGALLNLIYPALSPGQAAAGAAQHGLAGFTQALAPELGPHGVRAVALAALHEAPEQLAGAAAYVLARLLLELHGTLTEVETVLARAGASPDLAEPAADRAASLAQALALTEQLASLLMDTDGEFDRLPIAVRPMARGAFLSQVGYRSQDMLRAVQKLADQLQRMQASHSGTDTEFQVDYPRLAGLFERLIRYYQTVPAETARFTNDQALLAQLQRQMTERETLIHSLLTTLTTFHD